MHLNQLGYWARLLVDNDRHLAVTINIKLCSEKLKNHQAHPSTRQDVPNLLICLLMHSSIWRVDLFRLVSEGDAILTYCICLLWSCLYNIYISFDS